MEEEARRALGAGAAGAVGAAGAAGETQLRAAAEARKALGNERARAGELEAALERYGEALQLLEALEEASGRQEPGLRAAVASNQALCLLRLGRAGEAEARAGAALAAEPAHGKAAYRRGLARLQLGNERGAYEDLQKASRLEPHDGEVRQRFEEARRLLEARPPPGSEVAMASAAAAALGGEAGGAGGLYGEKPDLNAGRLAETHREQREWVKTITDWVEITDIAFADGGSDGCVSVYLTLPGVHEIPPNKVCVWLRPQSLEVRVIELRGSNWCYLAQELSGPIDAEASSYKVRRDKLSLRLRKRAGARSWDRWDKLRRI